jgi:hypothetical protein
MSDLMDHAQFVVEGGSNGRDLMETLLCLLQLGQGRFEESKSGLVWKLVGSYYQELLCTPKEGSVELLATHFHQLPVELCSEPCAEYR